MIVRLRILLLFLVGVATPLESVVLFTLGLPVTVSKLVTALLLGLLLLQWVAEGRRFVRSPKNAWVLAFGLAVGISYVTSVVGGVPIPALYILVELITAASVLLFYFLIANVLTNQRELDVLLRSLVIGAVLTGASLMMGYESLEEVSYKTRQGGFGGDSNLAGYNLVIALPFAFALYFSTRSWLWKAVLLGCAGFLLLGILLTLSRTSYVAAALMWLLWMVRFRRIDQLRYMIPVVLLAAGLFLFPPQFFQDRVETFTSAEQRREDASIQKRVGVNLDAIRAFGSSPLVGQGLVGFGTWASREAERRGGYHALTAIHNAYFSVAAEQGLLGLIPFLTILAMGWRDYSRVWRLGRQRGRDPMLSQLGVRALFLQISYFGALVMALAMPSVFYKSNWMLIGFSSAIASLVRGRVAEVEAGRLDEPGSAAEVSGPGGLPPTGAVPSA